MGMAKTKKCPDCAEQVLAEARKCRFCGYEFSQHSIQQAKASNDAAAGCGIASVYEVRISAAT
jgi:predicted Zn-ribbon and HTH transcriptional regulator